MCLTQKPITHEAERIFKIVLAGDAAVGKSSFILRLCKNKFIANLNSTLGLLNLQLFVIISLSEFILDVSAGMKIPVCMGMYRHGTDFRKTL